MVISRREILSYLEEGKLRFSPKISESQIAQVSIDLQLSRKWARFKNAKAYISAIRMGDGIWQSEDLWERSESLSTIVKPGELVIGQTLESVTLPNDLVGFIEGRSRYARIGISVHMTAPKIDPGFQGTIALEITNVGRYPIELSEGERPSQLILMKVDPPVDTEELYGASADAQFHRQSDPIPK